MPFELIRDISTNDNVVNFKVVYKGVKVAVFSYQTEEGESERLFMQVIAMDGGYLIPPMPCKDLSVAISMINQIDESRVSQFLEKKEDVFSHVEIKIKSKLGFESRLSDELYTCQLSSLGDFFAKKFSSLGEAEFFISKNTKVWSEINCKFCERLGDRIDSLVIVGVFGSEGGAGRIDLMQKLI